jgi:transcription factor SFP1
VKLESSQTPPPLYHSPALNEKGRASTPSSDSTPIQTPVAAGAAESPWPVSSHPKRSQRDSFFPRRQKAYNNPSKRPDSRPYSPLLGAQWSFASQPAEPLFEDSDGEDFPLFPPSGVMTATTPPIDIGTPPRFGSNSPRNKTSNLTSALQEAGAAGFPVSAHNVDNRSGFGEGRMSISTRNDPMSNVFDASYHGSGARPIMVKDRARRESNNAGSLMGGMSWGGISVGSWVRDE